jgi:hypothetical protein
MSQFAQEPVDAAVDALKVAEDTLSIAREATMEKEAAVTRAKEAEAKLVTLQKVASEHEQAVDKITAFLSAEGYIDAANQEKFASEMKAHPMIGVDLIKRIVNFSASPYDEGQGIPKNATEEITTDPEAHERALWEKVATNGA